MNRSQWRGGGCRIQSPMTLGGIGAVSLENEIVRVTVLSGKGADIASFLHKPTDTDFMWHSPRGLRDPGTAPPAPGVETAFDQFYEGGWQELFPHASRPSEYRGVLLPQHGEVWALPWDVEILEDTPEHISVRFSVETLRTPFRLERTMSMESSSAEVTIGEKVTNLSDEDQEFMWGHHPAFGAPFLSEDCRLEFPAGRVRWQGSEGEIIGEWPVVKVPDGDDVDLSLVPGEGSGFTDMIYPEELSGGSYRIVNEKLGVGFSLKWDLDVFKVVWVWRQINAPGGWHGRAYTVACEPVSHYAGARERGDELLKLAPRASMETELVAGAFTL